MNNTNFNWNVRDNESLFTTEAQRTQRLHRGINFSVPPLRSLCLCGESDFPYTQLKRSHSPENLFTSLRHLPPTYLHL
jgi:hypothetical protein